MYTFGSALSPSNSPVYSASWLKQWPSDTVPRNAKFVVLQITNVLIFFMILIIEVKTVGPTLFSVFIALLVFFYL